MILLGGGGEHFTEKEIRGEKGLGNFDSFSPFLFSTKKSFTHSYMHEVHMQKYVGPFPTEGERKTYNVRPGLSIEVLCQQSPSWQSSVHQKKASPKDLSFADKRLFLPVYGVTIGGFTGIVMLVRV